MTGHAHPRLYDKVSLVTGAGRGIGRAIALTFAREGSHVAIAELDRETGEETAHRVRELGRRSLVLRTDMAQKGLIDEMVERVVDELGRIDILVNNAGIHIAQPFLEVTEELFDRTIANNLKSQFFCTQSVARRMVPRRSGKIINIGSISSEVADQGASHYCVGKGGTKMLTRSAALELAEYNIQVNEIAPGTIKTQLTPWYETDDAEQYRDKFVPARRFGTPEDIAGAAVYLASDDAAYTTGATIVVDGGLMTQ